MKNRTVQLTMLNSMADVDFGKSLAMHVEWDISHLDLKDCIFGKSISDLSDEESRQAKEMIDKHNLLTWCFSTHLFYDYIEKGEQFFREQHIKKLDRILEIAQIIGPRYIRLLSVRIQNRGAAKNSTDCILKKNPWLIKLYREAIDKISEKGFSATVENEVGDAILTNPEAVVDFYEELDRHSLVSYTWDVQNMWQMGTFPSMDVYRKLRPVIGYYHIKGGEAEYGQGPLKWNVFCKDASWPVLEITKAVVADGVSPVICLNPSHGARKPDYDYTAGVKTDIDFIRANFQVGKNEK